MAASKKMAFPADACGACKYCRPDRGDKDTYLCWCSPPSVLGDLEGHGSVRGIEVGLDDPACYFFHQRANG